MTFFGKIKHIWEYYRLHIISSIVIIAAAIAVVIIVVQNNYERSFYCVVADGDIKGKSDHTDYLTTNFTEYLGLDGKSQKVLFDYTYTFMGTDMTYDPFYNLEKIHVMAAGSTIDGYLSEYRYALAFCSDDEIFLEDLRDWLTPQELETLSDYLIYYTDKQGVRTPVSIELSASKIQSEAGLLMERPCYGIVASSQHKDNAAEFIRFLFDL